MTNNPSIDNLQECINCFPSEFVEQLKEQTEKHVRKNDEIEYIKIVVATKHQIKIDDHTSVAIPIVITEVHFDQKENPNSSEKEFTIKSTKVQDIKEMLANKLQLEEECRKYVRINFASSELLNQQTLESQGVVYPDKIFMPLDINHMRFSKDSILKNSRESYGKMQEAARIIRRVENKQHNVYKKCVNALSERLLSRDKLALLDDTIWRYLLLIRNFAVFLTAKESNSINKDTLESIILGMLNLLENLYNKKQNYEVIYCLVNALEWQIYMYSQIFTGQSQIAKKTQSILCAMVEDKNIPDRIRMEACWAISWAGIANYNFSKSIIPKLFSILKNMKVSEEKPAIITAIYVALMRSTMIRYLYNGADTGNNFGWFHNTLDDHKLVQTTVIQKDFKHGLPEADELDTFLKQNKITDRNVLLGLGDMYNQIEKFSEAAKCYELSSSGSDDFVCNLRLGFFFTAKSQAESCIVDKIKFLKKGKDHYEAALKALMERYKVDSGKSLRELDNREFVNLAKFNILTTKARIYLLEAFNYLAEVDTSNNIAIGKFNDAGGLYANEIPALEQAQNDYDKLLIDIYYEICLLGIRVGKNDKIDDEDRERINRIINKIDIEIYNQLPFFSKLLMIYKKCIENPNYPRIQLLLSISSLSFPRIDSNCSLSVCPNVNIDIVTVSKRSTQKYLVQDTINAEHQFSLTDDNYFITSHPDGDRYRVIFQYEEPQDNYNSYDSCTINFKLSLDSALSENDKRALEKCSRDEIIIIMYYCDEGSYPDELCHIGEPITFRQLVQETNNTIAIELSTIFNQIKTIRTDWHLSEYLTGEFFRLEFRAKFAACSGKTFQRMAINFYPTHDFEFYPNWCMLRNDLESNHTNDCTRITGMQKKNSAFIAYSFQGVPSWALEDEKIVMNKVIKNIHKHFKENNKIELYNPAEDRVYNDKICDICSNIYTNKFFVAEVSHKSVNVWFETGLAVATNKTVLRLIENPTLDNTGFDPMFRYQINSYEGENGLFENFNQFADKIKNHFNCLRNREKLEQFILENPRNIVGDKNHFQLDSCTFVADNELIKSFIHIYLNNSRNINQENTVHEVTNITNSLKDIPRLTSCIQRARVIVGVIDSNKEKDLYNCAVSYLLGIAAGFNKQIIMLVRTTKTGIDQDKSDKCYDFQRFTFYFNENKTPGKVSSFASAGEEIDLLELIELAKNEH